MKFWRGERFFCGILPKSVSPRSDPLKVKADEYEGGIVSVILLDMDEYAEK